MTGGTVARGLLANPKLYRLGSRDLSFGFRVTGLGPAALEGGGFQVKGLGCWV